MRNSSVHPLRGYPRQETAAGCAAAIEFRESPIHQCGIGVKALGKLIEAAP